MDKNRNVAGIVIGVILVVIGILAFFGRYIILPDMDTLWPLVVVVVGLAFFIPLLLRDKSHGGLAIPGCILVTIGVILYFMNRTDSWEAWSYFWALIVCAVGAGTWINGVISGKPELQKRGLSVLRTGLILFIIFGVIMEFIFSLSGEAHWGGVLLWSILLILVGGYLLVTRLVRMRKPGGEQGDLFWPVLMIGLGLAAAISRIGGLSGLTFGGLFNLWPLLLIALGIGLIFRNRSPWVGLIMGSVLVILAFVVVFAGARLGLASEGGLFSNIGAFNFGNSNQYLTGSGHTISQNRTVSGVKSVKLGTNVDLEIRQGATESVTITGDDNIVPVLRTDVTFGQMVIRYDPRYNISNNSRMNVVLTVKDLNELRLNSSGNVTVGPLTTSNFNIILGSSCHVRINGLKADKVSSHITSSGDIYIQGEANTLNLTVSSSVNYKAGDLKVQSATVNMSSSADVTLWVVKDLTANMSSSGNISYYGNPAIHQYNTSSGRLIPMGNK